MTDRATMKEPIAIIGMACRYAGAPDLRGFWDLLVSGRESVSDYKPGRTPELDAFYGAAGSDLGPPSRRGGFIDNIDQFDADFFRLSPREAVLMDPQQRLLLELGWEALEDAGQAVEKIAGPRTGVFLGAWISEYERQIDTQLAVADVRSSVLNSLSGVSGRLAFAFNFRGPEISVNGGCASSLSAIHQAVAALRADECDLALSGGANTLVRPEVTQAFARAGALSPRGRCNFGDESADGFVRSDGAGMVILKRLSQAIADGDRIRAVIRGSAINHIGSSSGFLMQPSETGQTEVITAALADADVSAADVQYVEAHGTGTSVGDRVELRALSAIIGRHHNRTEDCLVGSAKTNIGHTEAAAGMAGVIKTVLALEHGFLPPTLHVRTPNPCLDWSSAGIALNRVGKPWPDAQPRCAGVSAFGVAGGNAHLVLEQAPTPAASSTVEPKEIWPIPISAYSPEALRTLASAYADALEQRSDLADIGFTASTRRSALPHRLVVAGSSGAELAMRLRTWSELGTAPFVASGTEAETTAGVAMVFPGQGFQWAGMGRALLAHEPVFRVALERCDAAIQAETGWSVHQLLTAGTELDSVGIERIQPVLFAVQVALANLWFSWGIKPSVLVGHSMGEIAAAHVAGALSLDDAVKVICRRSALMTSFTGKGAMLLVDLSMADAAIAIRGYEDRLSVAVSNGPRSTVLSGEPVSLQAVAHSLQHQGVFCRTVAVQVAAHSPQMGLISDELLAALQDLKPQAGHTPLYSTTLGRLTDGAELDACYWINNLRQPVLFHPALQALMADGVQTFIEASAHPILLPSIDESAQDAGHAVLTVASLRRNEPEQATMLAAFGQLFVQGVPVDWSRHYPAGRVVDLPPHPWRRRRYWPENDVAVQVPASSGGHPLLPPPFKTAEQSWIWTSRLSTETLPWLKDHVVRGVTLLPASAYVEIAAMAARQVFGHANVVVEQLRLKEAITLPSLRDQVVQVVATAERPGHWSVKFHTRDNLANSWTLAASGNLTAENDDTATFAQIKSIERNKPAHAVTAREHAAQMRRLGYDYGPDFLILQWLDLQRHAVRAEAQVTDELRTSAYGLHPTLLDAGFQALAAGLLQQHPDQTQLIPRSIGQARIFPAASSARIVHIEAEMNDIDGLSGNVRLYAPGHELIAEVLELRFQAFTAEARPETAQRLYDLGWMAAEAAPDPVSSPQAWFVLADERGAGAAFTAAMQRRGARTKLLWPRPVPADPFGLHDGTLRQCLTAEATSAGSLGVVHFASMNLPSDASVDMIAHNCADVAALATMLEDVRNTTLCLITRGACAVYPSEHVSAPQASIWGLGAVIANELPALRCQLIDLDQHGEHGEAIRLADAVLQGSVEPRVALRGEQRLVARVRAHLSHMPSGSARPLRNNECAELVVGTPGMLDSLSITLGTRHAPAAGEIEIEVHAAGLNFRDVLRAMGLLDPSQNRPVRPGAECAGHVLRVGAGVTEFQAGDRVIALSPAFQTVGTMASHLVTHAALAAKIPDTLSFTDAAALPCVYLTSYIALAEVGRMRPGESVLVHSATGGVGLSAIQIARWLGARIIASAGTEEKRALLQDMGLEGVFDSRSSSFAKTVAKLTDGRGVDVILNSLSGSAIPEGLATLAPYGRFVEIGRRDMLDNSRIGLGALLQNRSLFGVDLASMIEDQPERVGALLRTIIDLVRSGILAPLPVTVFPASRAAEGFHLMAAARHTGKVVIATDAMAVDSEATAASIRPDGTYLITGGLGALGLVVAEGLVAMGARNLVLCGRSEASDRALTAVTELRDGGANVVTHALDIGDEGQVRALLNEIATTLPPLRGVVHAAGILDDALVGQLSVSRFLTVMHGKVQGACLLDRLTADLPLDMFVMFSSVATLLGSPGQGNYAAANAVLDALATERVARGRPGLSIAWGPWSSIGLAAEQTNRGERVAAQGLISLPPNDGLRLFQQLLGGGTPYVAAMHFDPVRWMEVAASFTMPLFDDLPKYAAEARLTELSSSPASRFEGLDGAAAVTELVTSQLGIVLRLPPDSIAADRPFRALGLDSLMGLELRNRLERMLGLKLSASTVWNFPTVKQLCAHLLTEMGIVTPSLASTSTPGEARNSASQALDDELLEAAALLADL